MNSRELALGAAEILLAQNDGILSEAEAWGLLTDLRQSWQTHCAAVHSRNAGSYRAVPAADYCGHSSDLLTPASNDSKVGKAIGEVLLAFRTGILDVSEAHGLLGELVAAQVSCNQVERLRAADRANRNAAKNRISQFETALDARD